MKDSLYSLEISEDFGEISFFVLTASLHRTESVQFVLHPVLSLFSIIA